MQSSSNNKKMKIILFGGSFDPIHLGHIKIAEHALNLLKADRIIFVPAFHAPLKKRVLTDYHHRLAMLKIAIKGISKASISEFEIDQKTKVYSIDTIRYFEKLYPNDELYWIMGSDHLKKFKQWKNYDKILESLHILVYKRPYYCKCCSEGACDCEVEYENMTFVTDVVNNITSTAMRTLPETNMMDMEVINYINDYGIYGESRIIEHMKKSRYGHSLRVAEYAQEIMFHYNPKQAHLAYAAGLYHDIAKDYHKDMQIDIAENILHIYNYKSWRVLHPYVGAYVIYKDYIFRNELVLNAIKRHTRPYDYHQDELSLLDKILFCADKLEPFRTDEDMDNIDYYRKLVFQDLEETFRVVYQTVQNKYK